MEQVEARGVPSNIVAEEPLTEADDAVSAAHHDSLPPPADATDDDFEFAFVVKDPEAGPDITADEIFSNGFIRPIYPVFDRALLRASAAAEEKASPPHRILRQLLIEERKEDSRSASSSSLAEAVDELEGIPEDTYCVWTPGSSAFPESGRCKKSRSTGFSRRWRLRDLVVGRSYSDGKEKFVFLAAAEAKKKRKENTSRVAAAAGTRTEGSEKEKATRKEKGEEDEVDAVTAHRIYYGRSSGGSGRQTFLPYKQGLLGFFAHTNGLSRTHHPF